MPPLTLTWSTGDARGRAAVPMGSTWTFGREPSPGAGVVYQHPWVSATALVVHHDTESAQVERRQRANGAAVMVQSGSGSAVTLPEGTSHQLLPGSTTVTLTVQDFALELSIVRDGIVRRARGTTRVPLGRDLEVDDGLLLCVLAAALARHGLVRRPELVSAFADWRGDKPLSTTPFGKRLRLALATRGVTIDESHVNAVDRLVHEVRHAFSDDYLDAVEQELATRRQ